MVPGKSFCFLRAESLDDAGKIYEMLHGKTKLAQHEGCLYLSYCDRGKIRVIEQLNIVSRLISVLSFSSGSRIHLVR